MTSLVQEYNYDVFISYRQKDNRGDMWVSEFVEALRTELESTFKEEISVYFDINPHDGLLGTHDVDASLTEKLRCLVFIPIISRTYCDPKSFAWEHEFKEFIKLASTDQFGLKIRLPNGNVASRVLPVQIYDLDISDMKLCESMMGGMLRGVEFIYKEPGVNRPLTPDDDEKSNLNKTIYRNQINKVGNAVKEIISGIKTNSEKLTGKEKLQQESPDQVIKENELQAKPAKTVGDKFLLVAGLLAIIIGIILVYPKIFKSGSRDKSGSSVERISIAVMPFQNLTNDTTLNYLSLGIQEGIVTDLAFYPEDLSVRSFDLIRDLLKDEKIYEYSSIPAFSGVRISRKLDADFFIRGNIYKAGEVIYVNAQLIDSNSEEIIKPFKTGGVSEKIMVVIESLSKMIRDYLLISKIQKETYRANNENQSKLHYLTSSPEAYRFHILAMEAFYDFDYNTALSLDSQAVSIDSNFIAAIVTLCWTNFSIGKYEDAKKWLLKAYEKRDQIPLIRQIGLDFHYANLFQSPEEQIKYLKQLLQIEEQNPTNHLTLAYTYVILGRYSESIPEFEEAQKIYKRWGSELNSYYYYHYLITAYHRTGQYKKMKDVLKKAEKYFIKNNTRSKSMDEYFKIALIYSDAGLYDKAEEQFRQAMSFGPGNQAMLNEFAYSLIDNNLNIHEGLELIDTALKMDSTNGNLFDTKGWGLYRQHKYDESLKLLEKAYQMIPSFEIKAHIDSVKAALIKQN